NGKPIRYESPRDTPNRVYFPPGFSAKWANPTAPLLITEGEKKSAKADQDGLLCLGLVGVWGWCRKREDKSMPRDLLPQLNALDWTGRTAFVVFDSDCSTNSSVKAAETALIAALRARGASAYAVRLPHGGTGPDGKVMRWGLDDFLVNRSVADLQRLMAQAQRQ